MASSQGFEPRLRSPEPRVLPLDEEEVAGVRGVEPRPWVLETVEARAVHPRDIGLGLIAELGDYRRRPRILRRCFVLLFLRPVGPTLRRRWARIAARFVV